MKEPYGEGVASHTDPESCAVSRKAGCEALTGAHVDGVSSRGGVARYAFTVRLFHPLLHAGLSRRTYSYLSATIGSTFAARRAGM